MRNGRAKDSAEPHAGGDLYQKAPSHARFSTELLLNPNTRTATFRIANLGLRIYETDRGSDEPVGARWICWAGITQPKLDRILYIC